MRVLVCGTSIALPVSWGQRTWVHYLKQRLGCEMVNLSRVGCGYDYIHDSIATEVIERDYDLVIVSWSSFNQVLEFKTRVGLQLYDWDIIGGNVDSDKLQNDWMWDHIPDSVFEHENELSMKKNLFPSYAALAPTMESRIQSNLLRVISLQNTLKALDIPYMFTFPRKLLRLKRHERFHAQIDWSQVDSHHLYTDARRMRHWENNHPTEAAYQWYADRVYEFLSTKNLIKT